MAEKSARTKKSRDRHTKAEMNRNREASFGGALTTRRQGPSDSPGKSSSRARTRRSGGDRPGSVMAPRGGGAGTSGGTSRSTDARPGDAVRPGSGIEPPHKARKTRGSAIKRANAKNPTGPKKAAALKGRAGARNKGPARQRRGS